MAGKKHDVSDVHEKENEKVCECSLIYDVRLLFGKPGDHSGIHDEGRSEKLITTKNI
jgi:hypothetical protein